MNRTWPATPQPDAAAALLVCLDLRFQRLLLGQAWQPSEAKNAAICLPDYACCTTHRALPTRETFESGSAGKANYVVCISTFIFTHRVQQQSRNRSQLCAYARLMQGAALPRDLVLQHPDPILKELCLAERSFATAVESMGSICSSHRGSPCRSWRSPNSVWTSWKRCASAISKASNRKRPPRLWASHAGRSSGFFNPDGRNCSLRSLRGAPSRSRKPTTCAYAQGLGGEAGATVPGGAAGEG